MKFDKISHPEVWKWNEELNASPNLSVEVPDREFNKHRVRAHRHFPHLKSHELDCMACHLVLTHPDPHDQPTPEAHAAKLAMVRVPVPKPEHGFLRRNVEAIIIALLAVIVLLGIAMATHAEPAPPPEYNMAFESALHALLVGPRIFGQTIVNPSLFTFDGSNNLNVNCMVGCGGGSGGTSSSYGAAFPATGTAIGVKNGANMVNLAADGSNNLLVNCAVNCSGGATTPTDAFATPTTASLSASFLMGYNGASWDLLRTGDKNNVAGITGVLNMAGVGRYNATQPTLTDTRYNLWQLSSRGELLVSPGVSNFAVQAAQSGTWTVTGAGGTFPVTGTFWQATQPVSGTFWQATQPVSLSSAQVASGAYASGSISDGADVTQGAKADAKSTATDSTSITAMQVWKELSFMAQNPAASVGGLTNDGAAAAGNRIGTLDAVAQTSYMNGTAATQGRNEALNVGTDGLLWTANLPALRPASYHASASFAGSSTTVAAHLAGNATNTVVVTGVRWSCTQTTAGVLTITVNKTSAASSGGTAATMTAIPDDSNYAAASSVAQSFTGTGPTAGTPVGQIDANKVGCGATTSVNDDIYILNLRQKPIVLRGTAQTLEIGTGAAITGGNITVTWEWIETSTITP